MAVPGKTLFPPVGGGGKGRETRPVTTRIAFIGECMVELNAAPEFGPGIMRQAFGGDSLNACVYCRRALPDDAEIAVHYVTRLGDDPFSRAMLQGWQAERVRTDLVEIAPGETAGLYAISLDAKGERSFHYWRSASAARKLFTGAEGRALRAELTEFDALYFSGISLAILHEEGRNTLLALAEEAKKVGRLVAFDGNYRPRLWRDVEEARHWIGRGYAAASLGLPTFDDEAALFGDADANATADRLQALTCKTVVVKRGGDPALLAERTARQEISITEPVAIIDTTAAGDSFNGALLAARLSGRDWTQSILAGHRMAGRVIAARGAIVAADVTAPAQLGKAGG